ncbi:MAG: cell envelope integrity protein TolA [Bryobacteraceae bacterium]
MTHANVLDQQDSLRTPFVRSLMLHLGMATVIVAVGYVPWGEREKMGDPNAIGGGTPVTVVNQIPIMRKTMAENPVANDTKSQAEEKPEERKVRDDDEGVSFDTKKKKKKDEKKLDLSAYLDARKRSQKEYDDRVGSSTGAQVSSPLYGVPGSGGVGIGTGNPFGQRFGAYAQLIRECVQRKWNTGDVERGARNGSTAVIVFDILRNGTARNIRVQKASGTLTLDYSGIRAVTDCSPFQPLPAEFDRNSATIEFQFQLQR